MMRISARWWRLLAMAWVAPAALGAQQPPPGPPPQTELVFEREVFHYPAYQRRNPFRPLLSTDQGGPRFDQLRLLGVILSEDPAASVAVVGTSSIKVSEDGTTVTLQPGPSWYLKVGQRVGNITMAEIHQDHVVVEVEEFGLTERKTMKLETRRLGGTP